MSSKIQKMNEMYKRKFTPKKVANEIELEEEEDPCKAKEEPPQEPIRFVSPGEDPRFQQQNQTLRCYVMYTDFHQCEHLLGEGHEACTWFKEVYKRICPNSWIERWDEWRSENRMPWFKRAEFPKYEYGKK